MNKLLDSLMNTLGHPGRPSEEMQQLAYLLEITDDELRCVCTDPRYSYRRFSIKKRSGGKRRIAAPSDQLKRLQRRLLHNLLDQHPVHEAATAFRLGGSIAAHARRHIGQSIVLTVDLAAFFEATSARRIRNWFRAAGWDNEAARILTRLCVYQGGLPQGAPTSPALSNLVNVPLDVQLHELASWHGARYSRYCDDLAFSWASDEEPPAFRHQVEDILGRFEYSVQPNKGWRRQHATERPEITGVVIHGNRLQLTQRVLRRWRKLRRRWRLTAEQRQQLAGYRGLWKMLKGRRRLR